MNIFTYKWHRSAGLLLPFVAVILQSCASTSIELEDSAQNARIATFNLGNMGFGTDDHTSIEFTYAGAKIHDSAFVVGLRTKPEQGMLTRYNQNLTGDWTKYFSMDSRESAPHVWYYNGSTVVLTNLYDDNDSLVYWGRRFSAEGNLQLTRELFKMGATTSGFGISHIYRSGSPDCSFVALAINDSKYHDSKELNDMIEFRTRIVVLPHDLSSIRQETVTQILNDEHNDKQKPSFAVNNRGEVFYTAYEKMDFHIRLMLIRLFATIGKPDTLSVTLPILRYNGDIALPDNAEMNILANDIVEVTWRHSDDDEMAGIVVNRFDFANRTVGKPQVITLSEDEIEKLVDEDELENYRLLGSFSLPDSGVLLVLDQQKMRNVSVKGLRNNFNGSSTTVYLGQEAVLGPILVMRVDAGGRIRWKSALRDRDDLSLIGLPFEFRSSFSVTDSSLRILSRFRRNGSGILYVEFMLDSGEVRKAELPVYYGWNALYLPSLTQWSADGQVVIIGLESSVGKIIKLRLPVTEPVED